MKAQIIGYITALINVHIDKAKILNATRDFTSAELNRGHIRELNTLLDFVDDIPEEKQEPIAVTINYNGESLTDIQKYLLNQIKNTHFREVTK